MSKYNNNKAIIDGISFDSKHEAIYYELLKVKKSKGEIINFELQPNYTLLTSFKKDGKTIRAITYTADFLIYHLDGTEEVIDVKGMETQQGIMRRKMFWSKFPDLKLTWICRSLKYGIDGWIEYDELKKRRRGK